MGLEQYRVKFENMHASKKFAALASLWTESRKSSIKECLKYNAVLHSVASTLAGNQWEDEMIAFDEVEILLSSLVVFGDEAVKEARANAVKC
jgi:hypothetical protein